MVYRDAVILCTIPAAAKRLVQMQPYRNSVPSIKYLEKLMVQGSAYLIKITPRLQRPEQ